MWKNELALRLALKEIDFLIFWFRCSRAQVRNVCQQVKPKSLRSSNHSLTHLTLLESICQSFFFFEPIHPFVDSLIVVLLCFSTQLFASYCLFFIFFCSHCLLFLFSNFFSFFQQSPLASFGFILSSFLHWSITADINSSVQNEQKQR